MTIPMTHKKNFIIRLKFNGLSSIAVLKYVPIELLLVTNSVSRRIIPVPSGSCLSKLERVKANSIAAVKIIDNYHILTV